ncbi:MAG: type II secretion system protein [Pseudomonadota bacterium]
MTEPQIRKDQGGFTLLELLVTVGIMAAVAGTATLALQDTTARASAAAHVLMMDELNEGIMTFRALPTNNAYPDNFDSLMEVAGTDATAAVPLSRLGAAFTTAADGVGDLTPFALTDALAAPLNDVGINSLRYVNTSFPANPDGSVVGGGPEDSAGIACNDLQALINSRANAVVAGNLFLSPAANGCGFSRELNPAATNGSEVVMVWSGGNERVMGSEVPEPAFNAADAGGVDLANSEIGAEIMMVVGAGPSSNLFDASEVGGLTSVPVYRHVARDEYNRFFILFHIATLTDSTGAATVPDTITPVDQVVISGVIDGAGDTKEEELGEWDGTRNTI